MTTKTISTYYATGYALAAQYDALNITHAGAIGGYGLKLNFAATVENHGHIGGYTGILTSKALVTVTNHGEIYGYGKEGDGVFISGGGAVTNGGAHDTAALIDGESSGFVSTAPTRVSNFGTIEGLTINGVRLMSGGTLTNGSASDTRALVAGAEEAVYAEGAPATIANFGVIQTLEPGVAVLLHAGGRVTNGSAVDQTALIEGSEVGVAATSGSTTVTNFGTIGGKYAGVDLLAGGLVTNGSASDTSALIEGYLAVGGSYASVTNFGVINGSGAYGAVHFGEGGRVTNGSAGDAAALIEGVIGVYAATTVTNFGTIEGTTAALEFDSSRSLLIVEAGSTFLGAVLGGGGALRLASGVGTIRDLAGVDVTVSGSMPTTTFENFAAVEIGAAASFTDKGPVTVGVGRTLSSAGTLSLGGAGKNSIVNAGLIETTGAGNMTVKGAVQSIGTIAADGGTLSVEHAVTGAGVAAINGGVLDLASTFGEDVTFGGKGGVLKMARSQAYGGTIAGFSRTGATSLDLGDVGFVSDGEATFSGTRSGGVLTVSDGSHTANIKLAGDYVNTAFVASSDGHGGVIVVGAGGEPAAAPAHRFIAAMASHGAVSAAHGYVSAAIPHTPITMLGAPRPQLT